MSKPIKEKDIAPPEMLELYNVSARYGIPPETAQAFVYALMDRGLPGNVVKHLALQHTKVKPESITNYCHHWRKRHGKTRGYNK